MVNYSRDARLDVTPRTYRLRLLNGSSARIFRLAFMHGARMHPFTVIGTDGGLLGHPLKAQEAFLAPGERLDILLELRALDPGSRLTLASLAFDPMREPLAQLCTTSPPVIPAGHAPHGAAQASTPSASLPEVIPIADGAPLDLLTIQVGAGPAYDRSVPARLCRMPEIRSGGARVRTFDLDHGRMQWSINGIRFDMLKTQVSVERGSVEIWEVRNPPGGMPHPIHFHGFAFRLIERSGSPTQVRRIGVDSRGLSAAETGWKDTVLVWPGENVRFAIDFSHDYPGEQVYMLHCHNLEHEDQGMMLNVRIVPAGAGRA